MKVALWLLIPFLYCSFHLQKEPFDYGTNSPEARAAYLKGWEQILDRGEWTLAEASFREAVDLDSGFLLAWSQVGRISKHPEEREKIFKKLLAKENETGGWEKKLLEVYLSSLELIDAKDRGLPIAGEQISKFYALSESHFSDFLKLHPNEEHIYSEYIEVIHGIHGPQAALDTLRDELGSGKEIPTFLISYTAQMLAELKDFEGAIETVETLKIRLDKPDLPIISYTYGFIHHEMMDYFAADRFLDQTLTLDPNHILAQRLKKRVQEKLIER